MTSCSEFSFIFRFSGLKKIICDFFPFWSWGTFWRRIHDDTEFSRISTKSFVQANTNKLDRIGLEEYFVKFLHPVSYEGFVKMSKCRQEWTLGKQCILVSGLSELPAGQALSLGGDQFPFFPPEICVCVFFGLAECTQSFSLHIVKAHYSTQNFVSHGLMLFEMTVSINTRPQWSSSTVHFKLDTQCFHCF